MKNKPYVTVGEGVRGFFAVVMTWDEEFEFYVPWQTGFDCRDEDEAIRSAKEWAESEGIEYQARGES